MRFAFGLKFGKPSPGLAAKADGPISEPSAARPMPPAEPLMKVRRDSAIWVAGSSPIN